MTDPKIWDAYHSTCYSVRDEDGKEIYFHLSDPDLHLKLPQKRFAIITAWNPMNQPCPDTENRLQNKKLEAFLNQKGWSFYPTVGKAENHFEESFTIEGITQEEALHTARLFHQHAIVYSEAARPRIVLCR